MDPFRMAELLLGDMKLTPGQLAQLRAINTMYFTELYALQLKAAAERGGPAADAGSPADRRPEVAEVAEVDLAALDALIERGILDMLTEEQRTALDRNRPRLRERPLERAVETPVGHDRPGAASPRSELPSAGPRHGPAPDAFDAPQHES